jgi:hypothetical protein
MTAGGREVDPKAWLGALFFVGLGAVSLLLGGGVIGWVSLGLALLALAAVGAVRGGLLRPPGLRPPRPDRRQPERRDVPEPTLSPDDAGTVDLIVEGLAQAGVFAPEAPDPRNLYPAVADRGSPPSVFDVLWSLSEAPYWRPGFQERRYAGNLAFHETHVEQFADNLVARAADLARLAGGPAVEVVEVQQEIPPSGSRQAPPGSVSQWPTGRSP